MHWDLALPGLIQPHKRNGDTNFLKEKGLCTLGLHLGVSPSHPLPTIAQLLALQAPHLRKLASCLEPPIRTQLMHLGCDPQTWPEISMRGHSHGLRTRTFITTKSNAMSLVQSDFPKVILTLFTSCCCISHPGEDKTPSGPTLSTCQQRRAEKALAPRSSSILARTTSYRTLPLLPSRYSSSGRKRHRGLSGLILVSS